MFRFKQFNINDSGSAMKVGTDGVLLGSWSAAKGYCLDIGTGSGLIALMIAQRFKNTKIDAIDISQQTIIQAKENIMSSPWSSRINVIESSLQNFQSNKLYDTIICNPPYFSSNKQIKNLNRRLARTDSTLSIKDLAHHTKRLLQPLGTFSIVYPYETYLELCNVFNSEGLFLNRQCTIFGNPNSKPKRVLLEFSTIELNLDNTELIIEHSRHNYTMDYIALTKDFYINM